MDCEMWLVTGSTYMRHIHIVYDLTYIHIATRYKSHHIDDLKNHYWLEIKIMELWIVVTVFPYTVMIILLDHYRNQFRILESRLKLHTSWMGLVATKATLTKSQARPTLSWNNVNFYVIYMLGHVSVWKMYCWPSVSIKHKASLLLQ